MSPKLAIGLGLGSLALLVVLVVVDFEGFVGGIGLPGEVSRLMVSAVIVLANSFITYKIVRGRPLDPSYSKAELQGLMENAARRVIREEIETLAGRLFIDKLANGNQTDPMPYIPKPRPHLVRTNDGLS